MGKKILAFLLAVGYAIEKAARTVLYVLVFFIAMPCFWVKEEVEKLWRKR